MKFHSDQILFHMFSTQCSLKAGETQSEMLLISSVCWWGKQWGDSPNMWPTGERLRLIWIHCCAYIFGVCTWGRRRGPPVARKISNDGKKRPYLKWLICMCWWSASDRWVRGWIWIRIVLFPQVLLTGTDKPVNVHDRLINDTLLVVEVENKP